MSLNNLHLQCLPRQDPLRIKWQERECLAVHIGGKIEPVSKVRGVASPQAIDDLRSHLHEISVIKLTKFVFVGKG
jgi:hypothetical protein